MPVVLESVVFSFNGTPSTAALLTIESAASTVIHQYYVTSAGAGPIMLAGSGIQGASGQAMVVRLTAVPGVQSAINALQRTN